MSKLLTWFGYWFNPMTYVWAWQEGTKHANHIKQLSDIFKAQPPRDAYYQRFFYLPYDRDKAREDADKWLREIAQEMRRIFNPPVVYGPHLPQTPMEYWIKNALGPC